jgi:gas vesicle protein
VRLKACNFKQDKGDYMEERSGFGYFLLGLGIGVAAGILWAPRAGEETRQLIAEKAGEGADYLKSRAQDGTDYVRQRADDIKGTAADLYEKGRQTVSRQKDTLSAAVEAGKQAYRDAVGDVKSAAASGPATGGSNAG